MSKFHSFVESERLTLVSFFFFRMLMREGLEVSKSPQEMHDPNIIFFKKNIHYIIYIIYIKS